MSEFDFTIDDIVRRITELGREKPDHVYTPRDSRAGCANIEATEAGWVPGCIVGTALIDLGVTTTWFVDHGVIRNGSIPVLRELGLIGYDEDTVNNPQCSWIRDVQRYQDGRVSWGKAVEESNKSYPEVVK